MVDPMDDVPLPEHLEVLRHDALVRIGNAADLEQLEVLRLQYMGKKGHLTQILKGLGRLDPQERPAIGAAVNTVKKELNESLMQAQVSLSHEETMARLADQAIDVTLPGRGMGVGCLHPVIEMMQWIEEWFGRAGFDTAEGPEVEDDYHNFEALNFPPHHPARAMHDTFYLADGRLLRTHTSPVQIRVMAHQSPPVRVIAPGRVYRRDSDVTHSPMFHQVEGLVVEEGAAFTHLKGLLQAFLQDLFGAHTSLRFRASYFPFTEPSAEVDIGCFMCHRQGCRVCKGSGWLEVLGCGMVHPNVLTHVGVDHERYTGYAWGMGVERLAMLRYGISDLRLFFENDLTFLHHQNHFQDKTQVNQP